MRDRNYFVFNGSHIQGSNIEQRIIINVDRN